MFDSKSLIDVLVSGDTKQLIALVEKLLADGVSAEQILKEGLMNGMNQVGELMDEEEMFVPEVLMSAQAMKSSMEILIPLLKNDQNFTQEKVIIGTVAGDLHDIGKNLVSMLLESNGMEVHNLGIDVAPDKFVEEVRDKGARVLCMSALLTTTMPAMKKTIDALVENNLRDKVKIFVGGASVTPEFATEIGADGFAPDARSAVQMINGALK